MTEETEPIYTKFQEFLEERYGKLARIEIICKGHMTGSCPHCKRDEYNLNCKNYKPVRVYFVKHGGKKDTEEA